jgi:hypothetical protein
MGVKLPHGNGCSEYRLQSGFGSNVKRPPKIGTLNTCEHLLFDTCASRVVASKLQAMQTIFPHGLTRQPLCRFPVVIAQLQGECSSF